MNHTVRLAAPRTFSAGLVLTLLLLLLAASSPAGAETSATWTVCSLFCDFSNIAAALAGADSGDTIILAGGATFTENNLLIDKSLTIKGNNTVVQAAASRNTASQRVFTITSGQTVHISNVTIRYGRVLGGDGGGIRNSGSNVTLERVNVFYNDAAQGAGIYNGGTMTLNNTFVVGNFGNDGGGIRNLGTLVVNGGSISFNEVVDRGGGLYNTGTAALHNVYVGSNSVTSNTQANMQGGGILAGGTTTFRGGTVTSNVVTNSNVTAGYGAGIYVPPGAHLWLEDSEVSQNDASTGSYGGGLAVNGGTAHIERVTFGSNQAVDGGGLHLCGLNGANLTSSTVSGSSANGNGGGVYVCSPGGLSMYNATISGNVADSDDSGGGRGGGIYVQQVADVYGFVDVRNSLIADNSYNTSGLVVVRAPDCEGEMNSYGYNLIESLGSNLVTPATRPCRLNGDQTGNQTGVDPLLGPLADNGGTTWTQPLLAGSPAVNGGNPAGCVGRLGQTLLYDQRGAARPDRCDIGAFEYGGLLEHLYLPAVMR